MLIAPPGAPSRCPAAASGFGGAFAVCSRSSAPAPRLRAGPAHCAGPLLRRGRGCGSPLRGAGAVVGSRPRPLPWPVGACARPSRCRRGAPLPARFAAWGRRRAGWRSSAAPPWGGPPLPGPSGPPWLALAALRAALCGAGRPAAAAGSPLRAFPPGFGPRSSAPGGRWPAARACWAALRPPGCAPALVRRGPFGPCHGFSSRTGAGRGLTRGIIIRLPRRPGGRKIQVRPP